MGRSCEFLPLLRNIGPCSGRPILGSFSCRGRIRYFLAKASTGLTSVDKVLSMTQSDRLPDGRWRCRHGVAGSQCELDERHHGPCKAGRAEVFNYPPPCGAQRRRNYSYSNGGGVLVCEECEMIDAKEVLRLDAGGELGPGQRRPSWLIQPDARRKLVMWARRVLGMEAAS